MKRHTSAALFATFLALGAASAVEAQSLPVSFELRGGAAIPTGDWNEGDFVENGIGFGAAVKYAPTPLLGVYAGWDRFSFDIDTPDLGDVDASLNDSAFRLGAELNVPAADLPVAPFVSAGLVYGKTEVEASGGNAWLGGESDSSLGFEGAVGLEFAAGPLAVRPAVGYRSRSVEVDIDGETSSPEETISYLTFVIGFSLAP